jgi:hypothetical protein
MVERVLLKVGTYGRLVELMDIGGGFDDPLESVHQLRHNNISGRSSGGGKGAHTGQNYGARGEFHCNLEEKGRNGEE